MKGKLVAFISIACVFAALSTAQAKSQNGSSCNSNSACSSNYCYPGPGPHPGSSGEKYCLAADRNCALPGLDGADYGTTVYKDGTRLVCKNPGGGNPAQFIR